MRFSWFVARWVTWGVVLVAQMFPADHSESVVVSMAGIVLGYICGLQEIHVAEETEAAAVR